MNPRGPFSFLWESQFTVQSGILDLKFVREFQKTFLEEDKLCLAAAVRVVEDETGYLWHNFEKYIVFLLLICKVGIQNKKQVMLDSKIKEPLVI